jgi:hypothetical protein
MARASLAVELRAHRIASALAVVGEAMLLAAVRMDEEERQVAARPV